MANQEEEDKIYYVYFLIDSRDNSIFYIGKGKGARAEDHLRNYRRGYIGNIFKHVKIKEIITSGNEVIIQYFATKLSEQKAFRIEGQQIKKIGTKNLTNIMGGSRKPTDQERAKHNLSRAVPFDEWVKKNNPSERYKEIYWDLTKVFTKIAEYSG